MSGARATAAALALALAALPARAHAHHGAEPSPSLDLALPPGEGAMPLTVRFGAAAGAAVVARPVVGPAWGFAWRANASLATDRFVLDASGAGIATNKTTGPAAVANARLSGRFLGTAGPTRPFIEVVAGGGGGHGWPNESPALEAGAGGGVILGVGPWYVAARAAALAAAVRDGSVTEPALAPAALVEAEVAGGVHLGGPAHPVDLGVAARARGRLAGPPASPTVSGVVQAAVALTHALRLVGSVSLSWIDGELSGTALAGADVTLHRAAPPAPPPETGPACLCPDHDAPASAPAP